MDMHLVTDPYACIVYVVSSLAGGGGIVWRPHYRRHNLFVSAAAVAVVAAAAVVAATGQKLMQRDNKIPATTVERYWSVVADVVLDR